MEGPDVSGMSEREFLTWLMWNLQHRPVHHTVTLHLDILLPEDMTGPVQVVGDEW